MKNIKKCRQCEKVFGFQPHPIFWGEENSKIVQISQAPSNNVDKSGKPFTDMSGKKLIQGWYQIKEDVLVLSLARLGSHAKLLRI